MVVLAGVVSLIAPAFARAGTVQLAASALTFSAAGGEANHLLIFRVTSGIRIVDTGAALTVGSGCTSVGPNEAFCAATADSEIAISVSTGDVNDFVSVAGFLVTADLSGEDGADVLEADAICDFCSLDENVLSGGPGTDTLRGGQGTNLLDGGPDADVMSGGSGVDYLDYSSRTNPVTVDFDGDDGEAGEGDSVGESIEFILGGAGNDTLSAGGSNVVGLYGGAGDDTLQAMSSPSTDVQFADGGPGDDELVGGSFIDFLLGGDGADTLRGGAGPDELAGGAGRDLVRGENGEDAVSGGGGNDVVVGGGGNDDVVGGRARDEMAGGAGNDVLRARDGSRDHVNGGGGSDRARVDTRRDVARSIEVFF